MEQLLSSPLPAMLLLCAFLVTLGLTPLVIGLARRLGAVDSGGHRRVHQHATPLMGGLAFGGPLVLGFLALTVWGYFGVENWQRVWRFAPHWFDFAWSLVTHRRELLGLALGGAAILALGCYDDLRGLRARYKLLGQLAVAFLVLAFSEPITSISLPLIGSIRFSPLLSGALSVFWVVGLINAFNLIDGLDGLAAGIALIGSAGMAVLGLHLNNEALFCLSLLMMGHLGAFLIYNSHPARIFMGDTGSMFLGFVFAKISLSSGYKSDIAVISLAPLLVFGYPIFETLVSMLRRFIQGRPIFGADQHHTHHRLLRRGLTHRQAAWTLYGVTAVSLGAALLGLYIPADSPLTVLPVFLYLAVFAYILRFSGYLEPSNFRILFHRRRANRLYTALSQYAAQSLNSVRAQGAPPREVLELLRHELGLRRLALRVGDEPQPFLTVGPDSEAGQGFSEVLRVRSFEGVPLLVLYEFERRPESYERQDVESCLGTIFDETRIPLPGARVIPIAEHE